MKQLKGSEKQVAWAEDLRKDFLEKAEEYKSLLNKKNSEKTQGEKNHESSLQTQLGLQERGVSFEEKRENDNKLREKLGLVVGKEERKALPKEQRRAENKKLREAKKENEIEKVNQKIEQALNQDSAKAWIESRPR
ncbi:hypothetical protein WN867_07855 [Tetragenococcus halophilus]|uniref:hypothetical protein n=1 Tax=Tetragenococcus halophilus TaxID=51669 RepID=UPI0030C97893